MKRVLRCFAALATIALSAVSLAACSPDLRAGDGRLTMVGKLSGFAAENFQQELDEWAERSSISISYRFLPDFDSRIRAELAGENRPDLVLFDGPTKVLGLKNRNPLPLQQLIDLKSITKTLVPGMENLAQSQGETFGLPIMASVGAAVWYNPSKFAEFGYQTPTSDRQLMKLARQMRRDGHGYPWCAADSQGASSGDATTDWLEDYLLRYSGDLIYTKWWRQDLKFGSDEVRQAAAKVADYLLTEQNVAGGGTAIAKRTPAAAAAGLFATSKAKGLCFMLRWGSDAEQVLPADIRKQIAKSRFANISVFPLPDLNRKVRSMVGTANYLSAFTKDSDVVAALEFLLSDDFGRYGLAHKGSFVSPHTSFDTTKYRNSLRKKLGEMMANATQFGFDASDLLPDAIGRVAEPTNLLSWLRGEIELEVALANIDAATEQAQ